MAWRRVSWLAPGPPGLAADITKTLPDTHHSDGSKFSCRQTVLSVLYKTALPRLRLSITFCSLSFLSVSLVDVRGSPSSGQSNKHCPDIGLVAISPLPLLLTSNDQDLHKFTISVLNGWRGTEWKEEVSIQFLSGLNNRQILLTVRGHYVCGEVRADMVRDTE